MKQIGYTRTCSITDLQDHSLTFARDESWLKYLLKTDKEVWVIIPADLVFDKSDYPNGVHFITSNHADYQFTVLHNQLYEHKQTDADTVWIDADVHPSVQIGEGIHVAFGPGGIRAQLKHMGGVFFGPKTRVGPLTFIQRGTLQGQHTKILEGAMVDGWCIIAHNAVVGENTMVVSGSIVGAGCNIGSNCMIGAGAILRPHISVCANTVIGAGALVTKDITRPGIYFGSPAKFQKPKPAGWSW
jgi:UDP-3-O-[3-hydroxymyristoyl] glucosamine N-acyltransferase